jgi:chemotaxis protein MotC
MQSGLALDERRFPRIAALLDQVDRTSRLKIYLAIARAAMLRGRLSVTLLAGERALAISPDEGADRERAHFLRGAARALTHEYDGGLAELTALDRSKLPANDVPLFTAALQLALDIRKPTAGASADVDEPPPTPARLDLTSSAATLARAQNQLGELDLLIKDRRP